MTRWWLIGAAVLFAALLTASIVLALTSRETEFAPGTPERAVQDLLHAAEDEDIETAYGMLSEELLSKCQLRDYADRMYRIAGDDRDIRATLRDAKVVDGITFINVQVTEFYGNGPFESGEWSHDLRFALRQEDGEWKFTEYPWPFDYCDETEEE